MYIYNAKSAISASACKENEINKINGLTINSHILPTPTPLPIQNILPPAGYPLIHVQLYIMHWSQEMKSQTPVVTLKAE